MNASRLIAVVASVVLLAPAAQGQLVPGDQVRLLAGDVRVAEGRFVRADSASLLLVSRFQGDTVAVPLANLTLAEVLRGRHRPGMSDVGKGALIGGGAGVALGLVALAGDDGRRGNSDFVSPEGGVVILAALGTSVGALIGTLTSLRTIELWETVDLRPVPSAPGAIAQRAGSTPIAPTAPAVDRVHLGDTVRLTIQGLETEGVVVRVGDGDLAFTALRGGDTSATALADVSRALVRRGASPLGTRAVGRAVSTGALAGGAVGLLATREGTGTLALAALGATLGLLLGTPAAVVPAANWVPFDPRTLRVIRAETP